MVPNVKPCEWRGDEANERTTWMLVSNAVLGLVRCRHFHADPNERPKVSFSKGTSSARPWTSRRSQAADRHRIRGPPGISKTQYSEDEYRSKSCYFSWASLSSKCVRWSSAFGVDVDQVGHSSLSWVGTPDQTWPVVVLAEDVARRSPLADCRLLSRAK